MNRTARVVLSVFVSVAIILSLAIVDHRVFAFENNNSNESTQNVNENGNNKNEDLNSVPKGGDAKEGENKKNDANDKSEENEGSEENKSNDPDSKGKGSNTEELENGSPNDSSNKESSDNTKNSEDTQGGQKGSEGSPASHNDAKKGGNALGLQAVPGETVTSEVQMNSGESKSADFAIGSGGYIMGPQSGTATIRDCTVTNNASNSKDGGYSGTNGSAFISRGNNSLSFENVTIDSSANILVLNVWQDGSVTANNLTLKGSANDSNETPFLMLGKYPNDAKGVLDLKGTSLIEGAKGSVIGGNNNSVINVSEGTLTIKDSDIKLKDGVKIVVKSGAKLVIDNATLTGVENKPAIVVESGGELEVKNGSKLNTVWIDNSNKADINDSDLENCVIKTRANTMLNISGSKLHDSTRTSQETMIHTAGSGATINISDTQIYDNVNNMGAGNPGASIVKVEKGTINLSGVNVQNNSCKTRGGAFYLIDSVLHIDDNSTFKNNSAQYLGGVIFMSGTTATIGAATFEHNGWQSSERVTSQGGVIYAQGGSTITLNGTKFESNRAWNGNGGVGENGAGGAIFITGGMSSINVYGAQFTNNKAQARGGALVVSDASHAQITDLNGTPTVFSGNSVDSGVDFAGGGLFIDTSYVKMWDAAVYNNVAPDAGGAISTCATGTAQVWSLDGAAIFDNNVSNANSPVDPDVSNYKDLYVLTKNHRDVETGQKVKGRNGFDVDREFEVVERMFNNGLHRWSVKNLESSQDGHHFHSLIAQSDPTSKNTSRAKVVFTDNSVVKDQSNSRVVSGGAIGCNGLLEIGTDTEIKVVKVWEDDHNNDGYRPSMEEFANDITVLANGQELSEEVKQKLRVNVMDLAEHSYVLSDNVVDYEGEARDYTGKDAWIVVISGLPTVDGNNKKITYTVAEKPIQHYRSEVPDEEEGVHFNQDTYFEIENYHTNETMDLKIHKSWRDHDNAHNVRPDTVTVNLLANDEIVREITLSKDNDWSTEVKNLPKYSGGKEIRYEMAEPNIESHYFFTFEKSGDKIECENNYKIGNVSVPVHKVWNDNDDAAGARPESITVRLMAKIGEHNEETDKTLTLSADNNWSGTFENLPESADGEKISYWVDEVSVEHYLFSYEPEQGGDKIINAYVPEGSATIDIPVKKVWDDNNNAAKVRPQKVVVALHVDGRQSDMFLELNEENEWSGSFEDLPVVAGGKEVVYTIAEEDVKNYVATIDGKASEGFTVTNTYNASKGDTIDIAVNKVWSDSNNSAGARPSSVTIKLYANEQDTGKTLTLNDDNGWRGSFAGLPTSSGDESIAYTVKESGVANYTPKVTGTAAKGFTVTNTYGKSGAAGTSRTSLSKTGDPLLVGLPAAFACASAAIVAAGVLRRRRSSHK